MLSADKPIPFTGQTVGDFWAWAYSDVLTNTSRAVLAEWVVCTALGATKRPAWDPYDLDYGDAKVEVKSSAYIQNWGQQRDTRPEFDVELKGAWVEDNWEDERKRRADVYVFALYAERDRTSVDPLNMRAWEFYVVPTTAINRHFPTQKSVSLGPIGRVVSPVGYEDLKAEVDLALNAEQS